MTAETRALALIANLTAGVDFTIPAVDLSGGLYDLPGDLTSDLYTDVARIPLADVITEDVAAGAGATDVIMRSLKAHLLEEYDAGRITGAEYTKAYIAMTQMAVEKGTQFILEREATYWAAINGQVQAITGRAGLELRKLEVSRATFEAHSAKAQYATNVLGLSVVETQYDSGKYNIDNILPKQGLLLDEQMEAARAQTMDTRSDGVTVVVGSVGKQKALYDQQITSYQRDSEIKAGKVFADTWITQKTIDEGLLAPTAFTNASLDNVFATIKTNLNMNGA